MKALVVYDSQFGNTEKIAQAIATGLSEKEETRLVRAGKEKIDLKGIDLLVVGAPTHGGRPTVSIQEFLKSIPQNGLKDVKIATFDTRIRKGGTGTFARIFGYAAGRIDSDLKHLGGISVASEGFGVIGKEGPLEEGELDRARKWGRELLG
jgi:flavodoxin